MSPFEPNVQPLLEAKRRIITSDQLAAELQTGLPQTDRDTKMWEYLQQGDFTKEIVQLFAEKQGKDLFEAIMGTVSGELYHKWIGRLWDVGLGMRWTDSKEPRMEDVYQPLVVDIMVELLKRPNAFRHIFTTERGKSIYFVLPTGHCLRFKNKYFHEDVDLEGNPTHSVEVVANAKDAKRYYRFGQVSQCYFITPEEEERMGEFIGVSIDNLRKIGNITTTSFEKGSYPLELALDREDLISPGHVGVLDMDHEVGRVDKWTYSVWDHVRGIHIGTKIDQVVMK